MLLTSLPSDVLERTLFSLLDPQSLARLGAVDRAHRKLVENASSAWDFHLRQHWKNGVPAKVSKPYTEFLRRANMDKDLEALLLRDPMLDNGTVREEDLDHLRRIGNSLVPFSEEHDGTMQLCAIHCVVALFDNDALTRLRSLVHEGDDVNIEDGLILLSRSTFSGWGLLRMSRLKEYEENVSAKLDALADKLLSRLNPPSSGTVSVKEALEAMQWFFAQGGESHAESDEPFHAFFRGNADNYYCITNSQVDQILETGLGIPITLGIIYAAVLRRATGIKAKGIGLPGHFVLGVQDEDGSMIYVDPFNGAKLLTATDCRNIVSQYRVEWRDAMLRPVPNWSVWARVKRNIYSLLSRDNTWDCNAQDRDYFLREAEEVLMELSPERQLLLGRFTMSMTFPM